MGENLVTSIPRGTRYIMQDNWSVKRNLKGDIAVLYMDKIVMGLHRQFVEDAMISFHVISQRGMELRMMGNPIIKLPNPTLIGWKIGN